MVTTTDNLNLNLYEDNDPADLRDGYNGSMHTLDSTITEQSKQINNAKETAANAVTAAGEAQTTADSAVTAAGNAQTTADNAVTAAGNAQTTADTAVTAAGKAQTTADNNATELKITSPNSQNIFKGDMLNFGDSLAIGSEAEPGKGYANLVAKNLGLTMHDFSVGGAVFGSGVNAMEEQVIKAVDSPINKDNVSLILLEGGINNGNAAEVVTAIVSGVNSSLTNLRANYKNAKIIVILGLNGGLFHTDSLGQISNNITNAISKIYTTTGETLINATNWLIGYPSFVKKNATKDYIHPNTEGHAYIAGKISSIAKTGVDLPTNVPSEIYGRSYQEIYTDGIIGDFFDVTKTWNDVRIYSRNDMLMIDGNVSLTVRSDLEESKIAPLNEIGSFPLFELPLTLGSQSYETARIPIVMEVVKWNEASPEQRQIFKYSANVRIGGKPENPGYSELRLQYAKIRQESTEPTLTRGGKIDFSIHAMWLQPLS